MKPAVRRSLSTVLVGLVLLSSILLLPLGTSGAVAPGASHSSEALTTHATLLPGSSCEGGCPAVSPLTVAKIGRLLAGRDVPGSDLHLPALGKEGVRTGSPVSPTYSTAPAPMGVADLGLRDVGGSPVGYELSTSSAEGIASITDAESVYVDGDGPDTFGLELNAVLTNVTLFDNSSYEFWTQDFASYTSSSGELTLGDNLWNFSNLSGELSANALYAHGRNGSLLSPVFYYAVGPTFTIRYPFNVVFYLNTTEVADRPALFFNYTVSNASFRSSGSIDRIVFNASVGAPSGPSPPALFRIDGLAYDPVGLVNDLELAVVGSGNGDTTTFFQIGGTLTLAYWNSTVAAYRPVPSAVNAGADTGETSDGIASYYTGSAAVADLALGPSFLAGLWNSTTSPGMRTVTSTARPVPALILANPGTSRNASTAQWVPSSPSGTTTFVIPNTGSIFLDYLLSDYAPVSVGLGPGNRNGSFSVAPTLASDPSLGVYAPLIAWGNSELATFAASGSGTAGSPYVLYSTEPGTLYPEFAQRNDLGFPVFPGMLLVAITAYVVASPPSFLVSYTGAGGPPTGGGLPLTNDLQLEFWNVTHLVVEQATISGWLPASAAPSFPLGEAIFWGSADDLVANNTFDDQGRALVLYGGSANTVWGNTFVATPVATADPGLVLGEPANETGVLESESGDLLYDNSFTVPRAAYTPTSDPASCRVACANASYLDRWNISRENAGAVQIVLGVELTGSIVGTSYQGGNYWSNYGMPSNPYGVLPYVDRSPPALPPAVGLIANGGDDVPLVPFALYPVTFVETGLPSGTPWWANSSLAVVRSTGTSGALEAPNGTFAFTVAWASSEAPLYTFEAPTTFSVAGAPITVHLTFVPAADVTFTERGLEPGTWWSVWLNGTDHSGALRLDSPNGSIGVRLAPGNYSFLIASAGYVASPGFGNLSVTNGSARTVSVGFIGEPVPLWLEFQVPSCAQVSVGGGPPSPRECGTYRTEVPPDVTWLVEVTATGYYPDFLNVTLFVGAPAYPINVSMIPVPSAPGTPAIGPEGAVVIAVLAVVIAVLLALLLRRRPRRSSPRPPALAPVPGASAPTSPEHADDEIEDEDEESDDLTAPAWRED